MMDRAEILEDGVPKSGYLWCRECERGYKYGSYKEEVYRPREEYPIELRTAFFCLGISASDLKDMGGSVLQMCPYPGCGGDTVLDAFEWGWLRSYHPEYPEVPEHGVVYPLR